MKGEIRVLGIDDAPFDKFKDRKTMIFGTVFRGGNFMDGVLSSEVSVDGNDATPVITKMVLECKFLPQLRAIMLDGIAVGGFNVIDIQALSADTGTPVIVVMREQPKLREMKDALIRIGMSHKVELLEMAGEIYPVDDIFIQVAGIEEAKAKEIISITATRSHIPEPIRIAHLIAQGYAFGESKGRA